MNTIPTGQDEYRISVYKSFEVRQKWNDLIHQCLVCLKKIMEEVIGPAKEKAEQAAHQGAGFDQSLESRRFA